MEVPFPGSPCHAHNRTCTSVHFQISCSHKGHKLQCQGVAGEFLSVIPAQRTARDCLPWQQHCHSWWTFTPSILLPHDSVPRAIHWGNQRKICIWEGKGYDWQTQAHTRTRSAHMLNLLTEFLKQASEIIELKIVSCTRPQWASQ